MNFGYKAWVFWTSPAGSVWNGETRPLREIGVFFLVPQNFWSLKQRNPMDSKLKIAWISQVSNNNPLGVTTPLHHLYLPPRKLTWQWKIHHEWRCISYWTWEFSNVMLVNSGVYGVTGRGPPSKPLRTAWGFFLPQAQRRGCPNPPPFGSTTHGGAGGSSEVGEWVMEPCM